MKMKIEASQNESFQKPSDEIDFLAIESKSLSDFLRLSEETKQYDSENELASLMEQAEVSDESVFFYGSTEELLKTIIQKASIEFPALKIAGYYAPPSRPLTEEEDAMITKKISDAGPDLIFISLSRSRQEKKWMAKHKSKLNTCLIGLGQAFKVYASHELRVPKWMRNFSLEWAYSLCLKPARLWKRYKHDLLISYYLLSDMRIYG